MENELKGTINVKTINGKKYYIHQYREDGKMKNVSLSMEEAYALSFRINYSKNCDYNELSNHRFNTNVNISKGLLNLMYPYSKYNKRYVFDDINNFLLDENITGKVLILYGLRRTGKTTLIFQNILSFSLNDFAKVAYIKIKDGDTFYHLDKDLEYLTTHGFKYIFIDEVTLLTDFIKLSSSIADIYGTRSKVVLSGTDSLGFLFAKYNELYDRSIFIHTTYIPFKEFHDVLNINSVDTYIEYGGTMSLGGVDYNNQKILDGEHTNEYVDASIAKNIEHSLKYFEDGTHFASLYPLYKSGELSNVINRIVEDKNHRVTKEVIDKDFNSSDYGSLKDLLFKRSETHELAIIFHMLDENELLNVYTKMLKILNKDERVNQIDEKVLKEIDSYLDLLDVLKTIDEIRLESMAKQEHKVVVQQGLRYAQAKLLLTELMDNPEVTRVGYRNLKIIREKLLSDIKGRMLEEIVLYETKHFASEFKKVFKLSFAAGEIDMVVLDEENESTSLYEIKYSSIIDKNQYRHLVNEDVNNKIERLFYPIKNRYVIYNGESQRVDDIIYINVVDYLTSL